MLQDNYYSIWIRTYLCCPIHTLRKCHGISGIIYIRNAIGKIPFQVCLNKTFNRNLSMKRNGLFNVERSLGA